MKLQRHCHLPIERAEFDCVRNEVDQNLSDTALVTENLLVVAILVSWKSAENQFNVFEVCTWLQSGESKIYGILKAEVAIGEREGIILNLSKVKQILQEVHHHRGLALHSYHATLQVDLSILV